MGFQGGETGFRGIPWAGKLLFLHTQPGWNFSLYKINKVTLPNDAVDLFSQSGGRGRCAEGVLKFYRSALRDGAYFALPHDQCSPSDPICHHSPRYN